jgi:hypothetical protein
MALPDISRRVEVKKPGSGKWVTPQTGEEYNKIIHPQCPGNATHAVESVTP